MAQKHQIGKGITASVEDGCKLVIEMDLNADHGRSKSGKSKVIATTNGMLPIPGFPGKILNLNLNEKV